MAQAQVPGRILLENVRASFPEGIWTPSAPPGTDAKPAYNMQAILGRDHPQLKALMALIQDAATRQWKDKAAMILAAANAAGKVFLRDGNTKPYAGYAGNLYVSLRSKTPPQVLEGRRIVQRADSRIYSGCYVNVLFDVFPYTRGSNGIGAGFKGVQFLRDGEPLGGGAPTSVEDYGNVDEAANAAAEFGDLLGLSAPAGNAEFKI